METDHIGALHVAEKYYNKDRNGEKFSKSKAVKELAAFDLFTPNDLSKILGVSPGYARRHMGMATNMSWSHRVWNANAITALRLISEAYEDWNEIPSSLVYITVRDGNSIKAVAELTGVPIDEIRKVVL